MGLSKTYTTQEDDVGFIGDELQAEEVFDQYSGCSCCQCFCAARWFCW
jgi:hypothetical protein